MRQWLSARILRSLLPPPYPGPLSGRSPLGMMAGVGETLQAIFRPIAFRGALRVHPPVVTRSITTGFNSRVHVLNVLRIKPRRDRARGRTRTRFLRGANKCKQPRPALRRHCPSPPTHPSSSSTKPVTRDCAHARRFQVNWPTPPSRLGGIPDPVPSPPPVLTFRDVSPGFGSSIPGRTR